MVETQTLLIVDDCKIDREVFCEYLSEDTQAQYEIFEAEEAAEGLALCQEIQCDLILLDFRLPDMSGLEFLQQQQQQTGLPPSVIMTTGNGCEAIAVQALKSGADNYLSKNDLDADRLIQAVREAIRRRRLQAPRIDHPLPDAMAAAVLRFRRYHERHPLATAAVHEIRHLAQCDRASLIQVSPTASETILAQTESLELSQQRRMFNTATQRRRRGRPPKYQPEPIELAPFRLPIQLPHQDQLWGWLLLEYLPASAIVAGEEKAAFEALVGQLAIALSHAEEYENALEKCQKLESASNQRADVLHRYLHQGRNILSIVLTSANTLTQHRSQLKSEQRNAILRKVEDQSREFVRLLELISKL